MDSYNLYLSYLSMMEYCQNEKVFLHFDKAIKAIDATFQQGYTRGKGFQYKKFQFSGKHKTYGWKMEVAVGPDGLARCALPTYPGSFHNMKIFKRHINKHLSCLTKEDGNVCKPDDMIVDADKEVNMWATLMDWGYNGAGKLGRFLMPKKELLTQS